MTKEYTELYFFGTLDIMHKKVWQARIIENEWIKKRKKSQNQGIKSTHLNDKADYSFYVFVNSFSYKIIF